MGGGDGWGGSCGRGKMETTVLEQQYKNVNKKEKATITCEGGSKNDV